MDNFQKFLTIADKLCADIVNGNFAYGKPFLSRRLPPSVNISATTAAVKNTALPILTGISF